MSELRLHNSLHSSSILISKSATTSNDTSDTHCPKDECTNDESSQQRSIPIPAFAGTVGGLLLVISVLITMVTVALCIKKKRGTNEIRSDNHEIDGLQALTENVAYTIHPSDISTTNNAAYNDVQSSESAVDERYEFNDLVYNEPRTV